MFRILSDPRSTALLGLVFAASLIGIGKATAAGIVGYRNDTTQVVVVQSSITVNGVVRKGKGQMLSPGEVAVDGFVTTGARRITVYDPKKPSTPLFQNDVTTNDDTLLSIQPDMGASTTTPVKMPPPLTKVKLVALEAPHRPE